MTRYSPFTWADDEAGATPITATRLNALEAGADADVPVADIDATGTPSSSTYLRGDGTWSTPPGGGDATWGAVSGTLSDQTDLQTELDLLAPKASPAFTGSPTAPTPTAGDNDTSIATTAFVQAAIVALIAAAPGALDTLDELAAAMGDDANFATTVTNALALKAPLASPALTGSPTAPTPSAGDNDTSIATTAFVAAGIAAVRGAYVGVNAQTGTTYAPVLGDQGKLVTLSNASSITVTMPQDSSTAFPVGATIDFVGIGAGLVTFSAGTGATVNPTAATRAQWSAVTAIKRAANTWLIVGDLA